MYSNISQILLLYKTWWYYNKFYSTKSLGVRYRCVKIPQCGLMEHGLKHIAPYVQQHITPCTVVITSLLVREKPLEAPASADVIKWKHFRIIGPLWGNSQIISGFPSQRPVVRSFDVFFDLRLNKRLSKQSRPRWFKTSSCSLWRHCKWLSTILVSYL